MEQDSAKRKIVKSKTYRTKQLARLQNSNAMLRKKVKELKAVIESNKIAHRAEIAYKVQPINDLLAKCEEFIRKSPLIIMTNNKSFYDKRRLLLEELSPVKETKQ